MMIPMGSEFIRISPRVRAFTVEGMSYWRQREEEIRAKRQRGSLLQRFARMFRTMPSDIESSDFRDMLARSKRVSQ